MKKYIYFTIALALFGCASDSLRIRTNEKSTSNYCLLFFDTAKGIFDSSLTEADQKRYLSLWKKARLVSNILSPNIHSGAQCGTHKFLKAKWIVKSPWLNTAAIFLVSPGLRPCDFDESCEPVKDLDEATCIHTQFIDRSPVIIDSTGQPYKDNTMTKDFFNVLLSRKSVAQLNEKDVLDIIELYMFLACPNHQLLKKEHLHKDDGNINGYRVRVKVKNFKLPDYKESNRWEFFVDTTGRIQSIKSL